MQCCCGKIQFDDKDHTPIAFNDTIHEVLGPKGNFCGPSMSHTIRNLEQQNDALRAEVDSLKQHIERLVTEKDNCAKNWYDCRADLAAAVEILSQITRNWDMGCYSDHNMTKTVGQARSLLARLEVE